MYLKYIVNLFRKKLSYSYRKHDKIYVSDKKKFISNDLINKSNSETILYKFSDNEKYIGYKNKKGVLDILRIDNIKNHWKLIANMAKYNEKFKNKIENQKGGFILSQIQNKLLEKNGWSTSTFIYVMTLETIDIVLAILTAIPGLQLIGGLGLFLDVAAIIFAFLRSDYFGLVGSTISLIPIVGDIGGAPFDFGGIIIRILGYFQQYDYYQQKVEDNNNIINDDNDEGFNEEELLNMLLSDI